MQMQAMVPAYGQNGTSGEEIKTTGGEQELALEIFGSAIRKASTAQSRTIRGNDSKLTREVPRRL